MREARVAGMQYGFRCNKLHSSKRIILEYKKWPLEGKMALIRPIYDD